MNLYLDDDSAKTRLIALLRQAGNLVSNPAECGTLGASDARHFEYGLSREATAAALYAPSMPREIRARRERFFVN